MVVAGSNAAATAGGTDKQHTILEQIELSDESDDEFQYEELPEDPELLEDEEDNLEDINRLLAEAKPKEEAKDDGAADSTPAKVQQRPQVIDDFFRNFLIKYSMKRSLEAFQQEWYELQQNGKCMEAESQVVPDIYMRNHGLYEEVVLLRQEVEKARAVASTAKQSWDKFRKERDFHRMHHRRVVQEKNKLIVDLKRLKRHYEQYEPTLTELRHKYEVAMKEKMLMRLERDRFLAKCENLQKQLNQVNSDAKDEPMVTGRDLPENETSRRTKMAPWPSDDRTNPYMNSNFEPARVSDMKKHAAFKGHIGAVSRIAFHPKIPVVATACDDHTWKLWSMPEGQLVLSGEGHRDWVSGVAFHPRGSLVATSSGDFTVKIWDVAKERCKHTLNDHSQAVWAVAFHDLGDFMVSCSMDQTVKAFDMQSMRCRQTFRGHVDSVNFVTFQPFSNNVLTASADKTVSMWDLRQGLCVQTFYGHDNAVNQAVFNLKGNTIASCDSDGIVKLFDVRVVSEFLRIDTGQHPANAATFDRSGKVLAIASGDASIKTFNLEDKAFVANLEGHEDSVQDVCFEPLSNKYLISASMDTTFAMWQ